MQKYYKIKLIPSFQKNLLFSHTMKRGIFLLLIVYTDWKVYLYSLSREIEDLFYKPQNKMLSCS